MILTALVPLFLLSSVFGLNLESPCPDLFQYEGTTDSATGQWKGTLTLLSDNDLHGVWVRLFFDADVSEIQVLDPEYHVTSEDKESAEFLLSNRKTYLKANQPLNVKIIVKYKGEKVPQLVLYRLNARVICSDKTKGTPFQGDFESNFLENLSKQSIPDAYKSQLPECGKSILNKDSIKDDRPIKNAEWPWYAALYVIEKDSESFACEAALISESLLVTAAHCVTSENSENPISARRVVAVLGKENRQIVKRIVPYPSYSSGVLANDIAIVELEKPVVFNENVKPLCLPLDDEILSEAFIGGDAFNQTKRLNSLSLVKVKLVDGKNCPVQEKLIEYPYVVGDGQTCATYVQDHNNKCVGLSGSSVVYQKNGAWQLKGILSVSRAVAPKLSCGAQNPILFVDVGNYLKWIKQFLG